jgi:cell division protein FtsI (penicillin-binding protein 3)
VNIKKSILLRVRIAFLVVGLFGLAIMVKISHIQFAEGEYWAKMAEESGVRYFQVKANRGSVFSDNGSLLATSLPFYKVSFDATVASEDVFKKGIDSLSVLLSKNFKDLSASAYKKKLQDARRMGKQYVVVNSRHIDYQQKKLMSSWPIFREGQHRGGVIFEKVDVRYRPFNQLAMRTVGYTDDTGKGVVGIEYSFNEVLAGKEGEALFQKIAGGSWKPLFDGNDVEPEDGLDVFTTIDVNLQDAAENALLRALQENDAEYGTVVLMEVKTGAIKAMANLSKDPSGKGYGERYNYAVQGTMEPGSTFKLISLAALLEEAKMSLSDTVDTYNGSVRFFDRIMRDSREGGYGILTLKELFEKSSNVGISRLVQKHFGVQPGQFVKYAEKFHMHEAMGFQLKGEGSPLVKRPGASDWYGTTLPWMSIGYELKTTPLQMLAAYNAIANGGQLLKPYIVSEIRKGSRVIEKFEPEVLENQVLSRQTIKNIRIALEGVVEQGTATNLKSAHFKIAGKTGTAQIAFDASGYRQGSKVTYQSSFAGYFPAENPKYSCIVVVGSPSSAAYYGNVVAGPVFRELADKIFTGHQDFLKPMLTASAWPNELPEVKSGYAPDIQKVMTELGLQAQSTPSINWVKANTQSGKLQLVEQKYSDGLMPDVTGMTLRDALYLLENKGISVRYQGKGRVTAQSISPGSAINKGFTITLSLG